MEQENGFKTVNGYVLDVVGTIEFRDRRFVFAKNVKTKPQANLKAYVRMHGGSNKSKTDDADYYILNTDNDEALETAEELRAQRGDAGKPIILSMWDFCAMTGAKVNRKPVTGNCTILEPGTKKSYDRFVVDVVEKIHIYRNSFALPEMDKTYSEPVKKLIKDYGGKVSSDSEARIDYIIVDIAEEKARAAGETLRQANPEAAVITLDDFCDYTGLALDIDPTEWGENGRKAYQLLFQYYSDNAKTDGSLFNAMRDLKYRSARQLLKDARELDLYDAPLSSNDAGGPYISMEFHAEDEPVIKDIAMRLQEDGCRLWCGCREEMTDEAASDIKAKRASAHAAIVFLSEAFFSSEQCVGELSGLLETDKTVIPVYLDASQGSGELQNKLDRLFALRYGAMTVTDFYDSLYATQAIRETRDETITIAQQALDEKRRRLEQTYEYDVEHYEERKQEAAKRNTQKPEIAQVAAPEAAAETENETESLRTQLKKLQCEYDAMQADYEKRIAALTAELETLKARVQEAM